MTRLKLWHPVMLPCCWKENPLDKVMADGHPDRQSREQKCQTGGSRAYPQPSTVPNPGDSLHVAELVT